MSSSICAIVTGASSGIGWHISRELAARGYHIIAVSNQARQLKELKLEVERQYGVKVHTMDQDLSVPGAADAVYDYCKHGKLEVEVLVNNAGMMIYGEVLGTEVEKVSSILQLHMNTPVKLCRLFGKGMQDKQKGYILNISSISAVMPYPIISLYGPTKAFLRKFSRALRFELKGSGIHVTCLIPGATATALIKPESVNVPLAIRLGVMKKPEQVAGIGVSALFKNRSIRIPGMLNKFVVFFFPLIPSFLIARIYKQVKKKA